MTATSVILDAGEELAARWGWDFDGFEAKPLRQCGAVELHFTGSRNRHHTVRIMATRPGIDGLRQALTNYRIRQRRKP